MRHHTSAYFMAAIAQAEHLQLLSYVVGVNRNTTNCTVHYNSGDSEWYRIVPCSDLEQYMYTGNYLGIGEI